MIATKAPSIVAVLTEVLGESRHHPRAFGPWWQCPFCRGRLSLTANVWANSYECILCNSQGDGVEFVSRYFRINRREAAARLGISFPEKEQAHE